jgi:ATP-binding cassette, subfamily B, bacterial
MVRVNVGFPVQRRIEPRQTVALVGASGAGKTTVFLLLQRLYDIDAGQLTLDGVPPRELRLADLRACVATVPQEPVTFSGTILDNIRYGRPSASDEQAR